LDGAKPAAVGRLQGKDFVPVLPGKGTVGEDPRGGIWIAFPDRLIHDRGGDRRELWSEPASPLLMNPQRSVGIGHGRDVWAGVSKTLTHDGRPVLRLSAEIGGIASVTLGRDGTVYPARPKPPWATTRLKSSRPVRSKYVPYLKQIVHILLLMRQFWNIYRGSHSGTT